MIDANDFLTSGGSKVPSISFKDAAVGTAYKGTVVDFDVSQQRDFDTDEPAVWPDGNPKMQLVVTLQTELSDGADDDGLRRIYAPKSNAPGSMFAAIREAVSTAGSKLAKGATLVVQFSGTEPASNPKFNDRKLYTAAYAPADPLDLPVTVPAAPTAAAPAGRSAEELLAGF